MPMKWQSDEPDYIQHQIIFINDIKVSAGLKFDVWA